MLARVSHEQEREGGPLPRGCVQLAGTDLGGPSPFSGFEWERRREGRGRREGKWGFGYGLPDFGQLVWA